MCPFLPYLFHLVTILFVVFLTFIYGVFGEFVVGGIMDDNPIDWGFEETPRGLVLKIETQDDSLFDHVESMVMSLKNGYPLDVKTDRAKGKIVVRGSYDLSDVMDSIVLELESILENQLAMDALDEDEEIIVFDDEEDYWDDEDEFF